MSTIIYFWVVVTTLIIFVIGRWIYPYFFIRIKTDEINRYYNLLSGQAKTNNDLVFRLGVYADNINLAVDRLKKIIRLEHCAVSVRSHNYDKPPGFIRTLGYHNYEILLSSSLKSKEEQLAVLIHEMCHIYVSTISRSANGYYDEEKLTDCASIYLGFGIFALNSITDAIFYIPGYMYSAEQRFFGYLKPEQFGYLFARYVCENQVATENIEPFIQSAGYRYLKIGLNYLKREKERFDNIQNEVSGIHGCFKCGSLLRFPSCKVIKSIKCPKCNDTHKIAA